MARLFLQPPFEAPEVLPPRVLELGVDLLYSNSLLSARNDAVTLDVQVETAQPTLSLRYGLRPGLEVQLAIPCTPEAVLWAIEAAASSSGANLAAH